MEIQIMFDVSYSESTNSTLFYGGDDVLLELCWEDFVDDLGGNVRERLLPSGAYVAHYLAF